MRKQECFDYSRRALLGASAVRLACSASLYGARVYVDFGRRLAHAHAARQGRPDSLSQLIRDRRTATSLTFTLGSL
jgi:hypothetical protein